jgi:hypothetical protein
MRLLSVTDIEDSLINFVRVYRDLAFLLEATSAGTLYRVAILFASQSIPMRPQQPMFLRLALEIAEQSKVLLTLAAI